MTPKPIPQTNNLQLVESLCAVSPSLAAARLVHVRVLGMLVPHVFMSGVLERVRACMQAETGRKRRELRHELEAILEVLESAAVTGNAATRQVIAASFVGDAEDGTFIEELRPLMGRRLAGLVREV